MPRLVSDFIIWQISTYHRGCLLLSVALVSGRAAVTTHKKAPGQSVTVRYCYPKTVFAKYARSPGLLKSTARFPQPMGRSAGLGAKTRSRIRSLPARRVGVTSRNTLHMAGASANWALTYCSSHGLRHFTSGSPHNTRHA